MAKRKMFREPAEPAEYVREKTGRMIPCTGQAHKPGVDQDHCMVCLPRWGEVEEYAPLDLDKARADKLDVPCYMLSTKQFEDLVGQGTIENVIWYTLHKGERRVSSSYCVFRWT